MIPKYSILGDKEKSSGISSNVTKLRSFRRECYIKTLMFVVS